MAEPTDEDGAATRARLEAKLEALRQESDAAQEAAQDGMQDAMQDTLQDALEAPSAGDAGDSGTSAAPDAALSEAPPPPYPGLCGEARIAEFSWPTARLSARILELALIDGYGCAVSRPAAAPARAALAIGAANSAGAEEPLLLAVEAPRPEPRPGGVALGAEIYGGLERAGWFMPSWFAAANPKIRQLDDLHRRARAFRARRGERPQLHICPVSWPCHAVDRALIEQLGLEERFDIVVPASGDALAASMVDAWRERRPWLGSYWTPSSAIATHPMTRLKPGGLQLCETTPSDFAPAEPPQRICRPPHDAPARMVLYPISVDERFAELGAFLRRFAIPPEIMLEGLAFRAETNASLERTAIRLMERHPQLWRSWMEETARRAFEHALARRAAEARAADEQAAAAREAWTAQPPSAAAPKTPG